ncbi:hypothetical protein ACLQ25_09665 [Micromonospora sp. DT44]|uniref:hypothetical protein n=1 Tax=Micromonospora sp. DT44 TaxID=3393439 RepID=UPI003CF9D649
MSIDVETAAALGLPWSGTDTVEQPRPGGRHRWDKGGPVDDNGRKQIPNPVGPGHRISPAAQQLATRTEQFLPVGSDEATGLLNPAEVRLTNQWTQPVDRGQVLAEMRGALADPAAAVADIFATHARPADTTGEGQ